MERGIAIWAHYFPGVIARSLLRFVVMPTCTAVAV